MKSKKRVIITGGAGFIGSHIASRLLEDGYRVIILDNLSTGKEVNLPKGAEFIRFSLEKEGSYLKLKQVRCDAVFHLAGQSSGEASFNDPLYDFRSHAMSTFLLLEWCKSKRVRRFIYSSSMSVYGKPDYLPVDEKHPVKPRTYYAAGKSAAESYIALYNNTFGMDTTIFRFFSIYGPGQDLENKMQGMLSIYLSYMLEGRPVIVKGPGKRFRDFVYIDDAVEAWCRVIHKPVTYGRTYNVASGVKTTVNNLLSSLKNAFGFHNYPIRFTQVTPGDQFGIIGDAGGLRRDLHWKPQVDINTGIQKTVDFEKRRLAIEKS